RGGCIHEVSGPYQLRKARCGCDNSGSGPRPDTDPCPCAQLKTLNKADKRANSDYFVTMTMDQEDRSQGSSTTDTAGLEALIARAARAGKGLPPVERWNPSFCGD